MVPIWLHILSIAALVFGAGCTIVIVARELHEPQHMWIMNVVWPLTATFGTIAVLFAYFRFGQLDSRSRIANGQLERGTIKPFAVMVGEATLHCGGGCALGDLCAEWILFFCPTILLWLGWQTLFADRIFAAWVLDYLLAYIFGIVFQYFTIAPVRNLGLVDGLWAAIKADTLSLTAWQVGMYGFMAIAHFWIFRVLLHTPLQVNSVEFWFMMQLAMVCGFITAYPVNWWLLRAGIKEKM